MRRTRLSSSRSRRRATRSIGASWLGAWVAVCAAPVAAADGPAPENAPYADKVLVSGDAPLELARDEIDGGFDASGAVRALRVEVRGQASNSDASSESAAWLGVRAAMDTLNYGALSLDASVRLWEHRDDRRFGTGLSYSLYQTAMPFGGGWFASQGLGVIQTLSPRAVGQQASFFLPTRLVRGASTQWSNDQTGMTLQLSGGDAGTFSSIGQGSFYTSGNRIVALGVQVQRGQGTGDSLLPPGWTFAAIASAASGSATTQLAPGNVVQASEFAGGGLYQTLRRDLPGGYVQGNLLTERSQTLASDASSFALAAPRSSHVGAWFDAAAQRDEIVHQWGVHHLDRNLTWQGSPVGGNSEGGYYRWSWLSLRTQMDAQLSATRTVDRDAGTARGNRTLTQAGASLRQYIDQSLGVGGFAQIARGSADTLQLTGYTEHHLSQADVRLQAGMEMQAGRITGNRVGSDQTWVMPLGQRLMTSIAVASTRVDAFDAGGTVSSADGRSLELGLSGGIDLGDRLQLDLNTRGGHPLSSAATRWYQFSASGQWRFSPGWSLGLAASFSKSSLASAAANPSPIPNLPGSYSSAIYPNTRSRDAWVTLRYDFRAGSATLPIGDGARAGGGAGSITGVIYLDENDNGRLDANETRASHVTVLLDNRYATRTDAQGRYEFPLVGPGPHIVAIAADTLPLPWTTNAAGARTVQVLPRETVRLDIGARRIGSGARGE